MLQRVSLNAFTWKSELHKTTYHAFCILLNAVKSAELTRIM